MSRGDLGLEEIYLKPGELTVAERPTLISTVLGSCVALTLCSPRHGIGGICHAMLPRSPGGADFKYVDSALLHLLDRFDRLRVPRRELVIKLFGGADMFDSTLPSGSLTVGKQNVEAARTLLGRERLRLQAEDTGGRQGRKLLFYSHTGEVLLKRLGQQALAGRRSAG